jgi:hypothetical protein
LLRIFSSDFNFYDLNTIQTNILSYTCNILRDVESSDGGDGSAHENSTSGVGNAEDLNRSNDRIKLSGVEDEEEGEGKGEVGEAHDGITPTGVDECKAKNMVGEVEIEEGEDQDDRSRSGVGISEGEGKSRERGEDKDKIMEGKENEKVDSEGEDVRERRGAEDEDENMEGREERSR